MKQEVPFSSKRFLLTLTLCACAVILLQNHDLSRALSFPLALGAVAAGLIVCFLLFLPAVWLKKRWDSDVLTLVQSRGRAAQGMVAVIYSAYFLYVAAYFLLPYTDMFCKKYYTETNPCPVAFLLLACCVYAAFKGANVITRFGIFLFVLAMVTNFMMFGGSLSSLDMHNGSLGWQGNPADFGNHVIYFVTPCFIAALFACLSGDATRFRVHQIVTALGLTGVKYALVLFFLTFAAGEYAARQAYETFVLSRVAHFGDYAGVESLYMALATMSVFMIVSLLLCGVTKAWHCGGNLWVLALLTGLVFVLQLWAVSNDAIRELFTRPLLLIALTLITAAVIPLLVGWGERRRHA